MSQVYERMLAWVLPLVAPVPVAQRDEAHRQMVEERFTALMAAHNCGLEGYEAITAAMTAIALKPGETPPPLTGAQLIAEEVHRVRVDKERTVEFDALRYEANHCRSEMALAGACYADMAGVGIIRKWPLEDYRQKEFRVGWPWALSAWKPKSPREDLIRAGALIAMQLDLLAHLEAKERESAA